MRSTLLSCFCRDAHHAEVWIAGHYESHPTSAGRVCQPETQTTNMSRVDYSKWDHIEVRKWVFPPLFNPESQIIDIMNSSCNSIQSFEVLVFEMAPIGDYECQKQQQCSTRLPEFSQPLSKAKGSLDTCF